MKTTIGTLAVLLWSAGALAAPRIGVAAIKGHSPLHRQVSQLLCAQFSCVSVDRFVTRRGVNWEKAAAARVEGIYEGKMTHTARGPALELTLNIVPTRKTQNWTLLTRAGKVSPIAMQQVASQSRQALEAAAKPPEVAAAPSTSPGLDLSTPPTPAPAPTPPPTAEPPTPPKAPALESPPTATPAAAAGEHAAPAGALPWVAGEVGFDLLSRSYDYSGLTTANLRTYSASTMFIPRLAVEGYPLSHMPMPLLQGLGVAVSYAFSVGLTSSLPGGTQHQTSHDRLDARLQWRVPLPFSLTVVPFAGYRMLHFSVGKDSAGNLINALPDLEEDGLEVGAGAEYAVGWMGLKVFADFGYLPSLNGGQLLSSAYFSKGSGNGLDVDVGASIPVYDRLSVKAAFVYSHAAFSFFSGASSVYVASGASDSFPGFLVTARYDY